MKALAVRYPRELAVLERLERARTGIDPAAGRLRGVFIHQTDEAAVLHASAAFIH